MPYVEPAERVAINGNMFRPVREGLASLLAPYSDQNSPASSTQKKPKNNNEGHQAVFYNPIQQFNRDLSVLAILIYGEGALARKEQRCSEKNETRVNQRVEAKKRKVTVNVERYDDEPAKKAGSRQYEVDGESVALEAGEQAPEKQMADDPEAGADQLSRKRRLDEVDDDEADYNQIDMAPKKPRIDDFDMDEEELEPMELHGTADNSLFKIGNGTLANLLDDDISGLGGASNEGVVKENMKNGAIIHGSGRAISKLPKRTGLPFTILDALSATGLRALRYAKEIPFATNIIANDLSPEAIKSIELNIDHNGVNEIVHSNVGDARTYMYSKIGNDRPSGSGRYIHRFDVIDLDPYGTAAPFFDAAIQSLQDGGLLCVTCTDAGVFASNGYPEKAYSLYNGIPLKGAHSHEGGLRLILQAVATTAAKYGIAIEPLLSLSIDFYARLFIRIHKQPKDVKLLAGSTMIVYSCDNGCGAWTTQLVAKNNPKTDRKGDPYVKHGFAQGPNTSPNCEHCGFRTHMGGPMWAGPLHNPHFVQRLLDRLPDLDLSIYTTLPRLEGMLTLALEEDLSSPPLYSTMPAPEPPSPTIPRLPPSAIDPHPFFIIPNYLSKVLHASTPSEAFLRSAIRSSGYRVTRSHCKPGSFRTSAPWSVLWEIFREWVRQKNPVTKGKIKLGTAGWMIMQRARGGESKEVRDLSQYLVAQLKETSTATEIRTLLESAMYRLEHRPVDPLPTENVSGDPTPSALPPTTGAEPMTSDAPPSDSAQTNHPQQATPPNVQPHPDPSKLTIVFDESLGRDKPRGKLVRYQINPRANWGPMNRAGGKAG